MARKPEFKVVKTPRGWKVEIPASLSRTGGRERVYFPNREEARDHASKLRNEKEANGRNAIAIKPSLAEDALKAEALLKPFDATLLDAVRYFVHAKEAEAKSSEIEQALSQFSLAKGNRSDRHVRAYDTMDRALRADFTARSLATISAEELLAHVQRHTAGPHAFNHRARLISAFWRWCSRPPRGWCEAKTIEVLEKLETAQSEIGILTARQCMALLTAAEQYYPDCVPAFAISLFTGMRKAELERLDVPDITADGITVPASSSKTGRRRFIQMPAPLAAWLAEYPIAETTLPANWSRKERAVRRLAGWRVWCDLIKPPEAPEELPEWPDNALRHTHASVMVALGKPLDNLTFEFGHSGGAAVLKSHYVGAMSKAEAVKIWAIGPMGTKIPTIQELA
ncbi:tyrosine-type recombinase/integrase [Luteolibacter sp. LG18]|uniref:tyrosine-type recombinase/integrase n=1 Tax=Luteolibacter sp. LG18 TaxID=2819286 RepID=UPI002B2E6083|nr:hypothetical protein llg_42450 [Luteolibacter sp. LG18]